MSEHARVIVQNVWKEFRRGERHDTLRDFLPATLKRIIGKARPATLPLRRKHNGVEAGSA